MPGGMSDKRTKKLGESDAEEKTKQWKIERKK